MKYNNSRPIAWVIAVICITLIGIKAWLVTRINLNWDEFYFLSHVHALVRGDLSIPHQTAYTRAFGWLAHAGSHEVTQLRVARWVMVLLLAGTALMIWSFAARSYSIAIAGLAPLAFLAALPTMHHGGSFRADGMLAAVTMAILLLQTSMVAPVRRLAGCGALFGLGFVISLKMLLMLPLFGAIWALEYARSNSCTLRMRVLIGGLAAAVCAAVLAVTLLGAHQALLPVPAPVVSELASATHFVERAASTSILKAGAFPQLSYLRQIAYADRLIWLLMGVGLVVAVVRRRWLVAALALSLAPLVFYRNSFPYYYVVMLGPACVLVCESPDALASALSERSMGPLSKVIAPVVLVLLALNARANAMQMRWDKQSRQSEIVEAIHEMFPRPVAYVDRCGMISSFRKISPFLSTWGLSDYQSSGREFMPSAMREHRAAFILRNSLILDTTSHRFKELLPGDQRAIANYYVPYWGPISVAGAKATITGREGQSVELPFPGLYRVRSGTPISISGTSYKSGDIVRSATARVTIELPESAPQDVAVEVQLILAEVGPPPSKPPPMGGMFTPL